MRCTVAPAGVRPWIAEAVVAGGGELVGPEQAEALFWTEVADADGLAALLARAPEIRWVQLPWAGIEPYVHLVGDGRVWTCGKGVYAEPVAELALTLGVAGLRGVVSFARADSWSKPQGRNLQGGRVTIVGGGGITESLLRLLGPFDVSATVVRRRPSPMEGAARVVGPDGLDDELPGADLVVLALALTPETRGLFDRRRLSLMASHAWLVNVARGAHVVTDDLVQVLRSGVVGGAALDVTDPEPLPGGHPLWELPNCVITPHVGNTPEMAVPLLRRRIEENVRRWMAGEPLLGLVEPSLGY